MLELSGLEHVAIIMDGNRRWAKKNNLPIKSGSKEGIRVLQNVIDWSVEIGIKFLTVYVFSIENRSRTEIEISELMALGSESLADYWNEAQERNIKIRVWGKREYIPHKLQVAIEKIQEETKSCTGLNLNLAIDYGGRQEIVDAFVAICNDVLAGRVALKALTCKLVPQYLYAKELPDPDLIIRTGGECRLSNFLTWQSVYSELVFLDVLWPDFKREDFFCAIEQFSKRCRRFGGD
ncbi:MAG: di-trans,poly-cis-decaprenylcistransferase [Oscillospiraceae bacterium]|nr:di-trans,poly-cis-decaprenylcistransferase [Oscillospiraceae bacterium]